MRNTGLEEAQVGIKMFGRNANKLRYTDNTTLMAENDTDIDIEVAQLCLTLATPWIAAYQAPPSMEFSRQEYCNGLPFPSPGDLPNSGIELMLPALAGRVFTKKPLRKTFWRRLPQK